jgi:hypothetical protein
MVMQTTTQLAASAQSPELLFIPALYQAEFIESMLRQYAAACEGLDDNALTKSEHRIDIPDITQDIAPLNPTFFLIGAMYVDNGDPDAFDHHMDPFKDTSFDEYSEAIEDLYNDFQDRGYEYLHESFADDIATVFDFFRVSHMRSWSDPFTYLKSYYDGIEHYAITQVW